MTTDDFKQKCDEIHRIVCYLLDDADIPKHDVIENMWIGELRLRSNSVIHQTTIKSAIDFVNAFEFVGDWNAPTDVKTLERLM